MSAVQASNSMLEHPLFFPFNGRFFVDEPVIIYPLGNYHDGHWYEPLTSVPVPGLEFLRKDHRIHRPGKVSGSVFVAGMDLVI